MKSKLNIFILVILVIQSAGFFAAARGFDRANDSMSIVVEVLKQKAPEALGEDVGGRRLLTVLNDSYISIVYLRDAFAIVSIVVAVGCVVLMGIGYRNRKKGRKDAKEILKPHSGIGN